MVAGYYRVSQARDDMRAPDMYRDDIERYCLYRNLELGEIFSDVDYSGYRGAKPRPALEALVARRFEFGAVIVPKLSRFGRSMKDLLTLFDVFDRDGIGLIFLDMNIDTSTSQGRLLRHIMAAFAEYESDVKSDYSKATQRLLAREGRPHGPLAAYGYRVLGRKSERRWEIDEPAASIVRALFYDYLAGKSLNAMARELNAGGIRGPKGGEWSRQRVKVVLDNPAYAGFRVYEGEEFAAAWEPLVSREVWDEVKRRRHAARSTYVDPPGRRAYLLSGLLVCGLCGRKLVHGQSSDRGGIYRCVTGDAKPPRCLGGQIKADRAERLVTRAFFDVAAMAGDDVGSRWRVAGIDGRRALLSKIIDRVELMARPAGNRHSRGMPIGRTVRILWANESSLAAFGYVGATSTLTASDGRVTSPRGKSWDEWRRARLLSAQS